MESVHLLHTTVQMHDLWINPLTHTHERFCCCKTAQLLQLMLMCSHVCSIWLLMLLNANAMLVLVPIFPFHFCCVIILTQQRQKAMHGEHSEHQMKCDLQY